MAEPSNARRGALDGGAKSPEATHGAIDAIDASPSNRDDGSGWSTPTQAVLLVVQRENLQVTSRIALVVGTALFAINQLDVVATGHATASTWVKVATTFLVPFVVSNLGLLHGRHRPKSLDADRSNAGQRPHTERDGQRPGAT